MPIQSDNGIPMVVSGRQFLVLLGKPMQTFVLFLKLLCLCPALCCQSIGQNSAAKNYPEPRQGDFKIQNYRFKSGATLPTLNLHYLTLGSPQWDASGKVTNAVLLLHGTGGSGRQFLNPRFATVLFAPGQLLDATRYFIIAPDNIGHGHSSKPSDGLHAKFPRYEYEDMVALQHQLLTDGLRVNHLRLILGTSMGCMHAWLWGETYSDFMDALMPLACNPVEIAGRNRIMRKMAMDAIRNDSKWMNGEYRSQPPGLVSALYILSIMGSSALQMQKDYPTRAQADAYLSSFLKRRLATTDANDLLYQFDSSRNYDPSSRLDRIKSPVMAINSADDVINPPELHILEREIKKVKRGRAVLLPISDKTRGHGTHTLAGVWKDYLAQLLQESAQ